MKKLVRNFALLIAIAATTTMTSCQKELDEVAPTSKQTLTSAEAERNPPVAVIIR
jgi:hypothetical protein